MKRKIFHQELMLTDLGFAYQLRLSNRKTAAIEIKHGVVTVAAPKHASKEQLHQWVAAKSNKRFMHCKPRININKLGV